MSRLVWNRYGKSRIRLVKVRRPSTGSGQADHPHEIVDLTLDVQLEGAFETVYVDGNNASCLATDTMTPRRKNAANSKTCCGDTSRAKKVPGTPAGRLRTSHFAFR